MPVQYGDVVNCSIESPGDLDVFAISATKDDLISANVNYTGNEDDCTNIQLFLRGLDDESNLIVNGNSATLCGGTRIELKAVNNRALLI